MGDHTSSTDDHDSVQKSGPFILSAKGTWGAGKHSALLLEEGGVTDLSKPPDDDPADDGYESTYVFEEDVEPQQGLDVLLGSQVIAFTTFDGKTTAEVRDV